MKLKKLLILILMSLMATSAIFAQNNIAVSTFDIAGGVVTTEEAEAITELFIAELVSTGKVTVVDRANFDKIIKEMKFQASDWSNREKTVALGNAINATMVARGQILKLGSRMYLTSTIIDLKTAVVLSSAKEQFGSVDNIFDLLPTYTKELAKSINSNGAKTYDIGDVGPGGGIVFYVSEVAFPVHQPNGSSKMCNYLEVSQLEVGKISWCACPYGKKNNQWCNVSTSDGLGAGLINTCNIISAHNSATTTNCAAYACSKYYTQTTQQGEWYLPSKTELDLLYRNLRDKVISTGSNDWYLSSSMCGNHLAWYQKFSDGRQYYLFKYENYSVRAVRAF